MYLDYTASRTIDGHVRKIKQQVDKSRRDPQTRMLALKIINGRVDGERRMPRTGRMVPIIRAFGTDLTAPSITCPARDEECEIRAVWDFVKKNVRYTFDSQDYDDFATLERTLQAGGGDCDDFVIVFTSLLAEAGFVTGARVIASDEGGGDWDHIYALAGICSKSRPTRMVPLDATVEGKKPGWQYRHILREKDYRF